MQYCSCTVVVEQQLYTESTFNSIQHGGGCKIYPTTKFTRLGSGSIRLEKSLLKMHSFLKCHTLKKGKKSKKKDTHSSFSSPVLTTLRAHTHYLSASVTTEPSRLRPKTTYLSHTPLTAAFSSLGNN